jgi:hypothetical protein
MQGVARYPSQYAVPVQETASCTRPRRRRVFLPSNRRSASCTRHGVDRDGTAGGKFWINETKPQTAGSKRLIVGRANPSTGLPSAKAASWRWAAYGSPVRLVGRKGRRARVAIEAPSGAVFRSIGCDEWPAVNGRACNQAGPPPERIYR